MKKQKSSRPASASKSAKSAGFALRAPLDTSTCIAPPALSNEKAALAPPAATTLALRRLDQPSRAQALRSKSGFDLDVHQQLARELDSALGAPRPLGPFPLGEDPAAELHPAVFDFLRDLI